VRRLTILWWVAVLASLSFAVWLAAAQGDDPFRPRHFGYYLAGAAFAAGLAFGARGIVLAPAGIVAFGIVLLITVEPPPPPAEDQSGLVVGVFFILAPAMFAVPGAVGALIRFVLNRLLRD
jgi:hypothetical protein